MTDADTYSDLLNLLFKCKSMIKPIFKKNIHKGFLIKYLFDFSNFLNLNPENSIKFCFYCLGYEKQKESICQR